MDVGFQEWLVRKRGVSVRTAAVYAAMMMRALAASGDVAAAVYEARRPGTRRVALSAVRAWSEWSGDAVVVRRCRLRFRPVRTPATEEEVRAVVRALRRRREPFQSAAILAVTAGIRLDDVFWISREHATIGVTDKRVPVIREAGRDYWWYPGREARRAMTRLLRWGSWEIIRDVLGPTAQTAHLRLARIVRRACKRAGIRRLRPSDFAGRGNLDTNATEGYKGDADAGRTSAQL